MSASAVRLPMSTPKRLYTFTLILPGLTKLTTQLQDALFEAGCDDALLGVQDGVVFLDFSRRARSAEEAIQSALMDVNRAGVQRVDLAESDAIPKVAHRRRA